MFRWSLSRLLTLPWRLKQPISSTNGVEYSGRISEGDCVILRPKGSPKSPVFTKPLSQGGVTRTRWGSINHDSIMGKEARDVVVTNKAHELRLILPTLDDYVTLTPRLVTPIYPSDANLIVSLLDLSPSPQAADDSAKGPSIEILEAGTGHGALTLFLARAIHAANPALPSSIREAFGRSSLELSSTTTSNEANVSNDVLASTNLKDWKARRRAVIHTLDMSPHHMAHARRVVYGYRQGQYFGNVDFYAADLGSWLASEKLTRSLKASSDSRPSFSHVILDLPASHTYLDSISSVLRQDGPLVVFNPSITQIQDCVRRVREERLPLVLEQVLELGAGWTGGREWDIRTVRPRKNVREEAEVRQIGAASGAAKADGIEVDDMSSPDAGKTVATEGAFKEHEDEEDWKMICRPKVGARVVGGGFLGVWRKMKHRETIT